MSFSIFDNAKEMFFLTDYLVLLHISIEYEKDLTRKVMKRLNLLTFSPYSTLDPPVIHSFIPRFAFRTFRICVISKQ